MLVKIGNVLDKVLSAFAFLFTIAFCVSVIIQIICRAVPAFPIPAWTEELARYCFIYAVASAAGLAVRGNAYVSVDIITNQVPKRFKKAYAIVLNLFLCAFAIFFETQSAIRFAGLKRRMVSTAMEMPMQWVYFALVILFAMLFITYLLEALILITGQGKVKEAVLQ